MSRMCSLGKRLHTHFWMYFYLGLSLRVFFSKEYSAVSIWEYMRETDSTHAHMSLQNIPMLCYAKSLQSCLTLCDPIDGSPPGLPVPWILQARTLECVAISFSNACKWKVKAKLLSRVWPSVTLWTAAFQAPPSMGFSRQEYWSGVPLPSPTEHP